MISREQAIPHLLVQIHNQCGLEKTASIVDAIVGAPVGAVAARIASDEENKDEATRQGLIVGALLGFLAGQKAVSDSAQDKETPAYLNPAIAAALGGAAVGAIK